MTRLSRERVYGIPAYDEPKAKSESKPNVKPKATPKATSKATPASMGAGNSGTEAQG